MKLKLRILAPMLSEAVGRNELDVDFAGRTVADLIGHLTQRYGRRAREALCDSQGTLDLVVQVLINERKWVTRENLDTPLADGDEVTILMLVSGG